MTDIMKTSRVTDKVKKQELRVKNKKLINELTRDLIDDGKKELLDVLNEMLVEWPNGRNSNNDTYRVVLGDKEIECRIIINTRAGNGRNKMKNYVWIPIVVEIIDPYGNKDEIIGKELYKINFFEQDMDRITGNVHMFQTGEIQLWHNLIEFKGAEYGGEIHPKPIDATKELSGKYLELMGYLSKGEKVYESYLNPYNAFPIALPDCQKPKGEIKPWGIPLTDLGITDEKYLPVMDLGDENYSAKNLAVFIMKLIAEDIRRKYLS